jgi:hypothetical protein
MFACRGPALATYGGDAQLRGQAAPACSAHRYGTATVNRHLRCLPTRAPMGFMRPREGRFRIGMAFKRSPGRIQGIHGHTHALWRGMNLIHASRHAVARGVNLIPGSHSPARRVG